MNGSSWRRSRPTVVATSDVDEFSIGDCAVTSTVELTWPTVRRALTVLVWLVETSMPVVTDFSKPAFWTVSSYLPGIRESRLKMPSLLETVSEDTLVSMLLTRTAAPGMEDPELSVTDPVIWPRLDWPKAQTVDERIIAAATAKRATNFMAKTPCCGG